MKKMPRTSISRVNTKMRKMTIHRGNIRQFQKLLNRRDIRKTTVNKLFKVLEDGNHFETPFVVNAKNGRLRLIDANHREDAIEKYLQKYPNRKVEVWLAVYENLSEAEEKIEFTVWNSGMKQTTNDFIKQYWNNMPITRLFTPRTAWKVSHKWTANSIEFKQLATCYLTRNTSPFKGGFSGSAMDFVEEAKTLGQNDYNVLNAFLKDYIAIFGNPNKKNPHYRQPVFFSMMRIWLDNKTNFSMDALRRSMARIRNHERVFYYEKWGGANSITQQCHKDLIDVLNGNRTRNLFSDGSQTTP